MATGTAHNLNESRAQALQALERVSERLGDILGGEVPGDGTHRNENGELVNEEGLPIIDITEPIDDLDTPSLSAATEEDEVIEDNYPEPLSKLSPEALAISRKHRDKILDLLEEEETREERRTREERQAELQQKREAARSEMQKHMVTQSAELEKRRRAKEMEKKMAKALISGLTDEKPATEVEVAPKPINKEKKSVSFADAPTRPKQSSSKPQEHAEAITWGDVVPGRLSEKQKLASRSHSQPIKMEVVERPISKSSPSQPPEPLEPNDKGRDSDDESDSEEHSDSTLTLESDDEDLVLSAQRHRELALEYHRRREALASSAGVIQVEDIGFGNESTNFPEDSWEKENVPLEATLAHSPPKPNISKFKAELVNSGPEQTAPSQSHRPPGPSSGLRFPDSSSTFGASVLPPSALAKSIKLGKLVDGQLVAGYEQEGEEEREAREEEEIRKLLLKSMEDYSSIAAQVMGPADSYWAESKPTDTGSSSATKQPPAEPKEKPKVSRFKVNRTESRSPSATAVTRPTNISPDLPRFAPTVIDSSTRSGSTTPLSSTKRSSPKSTPQELGPTSENTDSSPLSLSPQNFVIDSPSFAPMKGSPLRGMSRPGNNDFRSPRSLPVTDTQSFPCSPVIKSPSVSHQLPTVIDSPSFAQPQATIDSPSFSQPPTIIDSPSFQRPKASPSGPQASLPGSSANVASSIPAERESMTMTNNVMERSTNRDPSVTKATEVKPRKISRFKAERSGE